MKKNFRKVLLMLFVGLTISLLSSCDKSDDNGTFPTNESALIGKWKLNKVDINTDDIVAFFKKHDFSDEASKKTAQTIKEGVSSLFETITLGNLNLVELGIKDSDGKINPMTGKWKYSPESGILNLTLNNDKDTINIPFSVITKDDNNLKLISTEPLSSYNLDNDAITKTIMSDLKVTMTLNISKIESAKNLDNLPTK